MGITMGGYEDKGNDRNIPLPRVRSHPERIVALEDEEEGDGDMMGMDTDGKHTVGNHHSYKQQERQQNSNNNNNNSMRNAYNNNTNNNSHRSYHSRSGSDAHSYGAENNRELEVVTS